MINMFRGIYLFWRAIVCLPIRMTALLVVTSPQLLPFFVLFAVPRDVWAKIHWMNLYGRFWMPDLFEPTTKTAETILICWCFFFGEDVLFVSLFVFECFFLFYDSDRRDLWSAIIVVQVNSIYFSRIYMGYFVMHWYTFSIEIRAQRCVTLK